MKAYSRMKLQVLSTKKKNQKDKKKPKKQTNEQKLYFILALYPY